MAEQSRLTAMVRTLERWWSAEDPRLRVKGFAGKLLVEAGGMALVVLALAGSVTLVLVAVPWLDVPPLTRGALGAAIGLFLYLEKRVWCTIIRERDDTDGS